METTAITRATRLLWDDHQRIRERHQAFAEELDAVRKGKRADELLEELEAHSRVEECLVYPELVRECASDTLARPFCSDHGEIRRLISEFRLGREEGGLSLDSLALVARIMTLFHRHVAEEEAKAFPILEANATRNEAMGGEVARLKRKLGAFAPIARIIDVGVPVRVAYDQWTQFETFPRILENVKSVRQLDDTHVEWLVEMAGKEVSWTSEIYEQIPDRRIAWSTLEGTPNAGSVTFRALGPGTTRMLVEIAYEPQGLLEDLGAMTGLVSRRIGADLERFRQFVEGRMSPTGAWRGKIQGTPADPHLPPAPGGAGASPNP